MTKDNQTMCFVATPEQKKTLESWAVLEDRSISAVIRRILDAEIERRKDSETNQPKAEVN